MSAHPDPLSRMTTLLDQGEMAAVRAAEEAGEPALEALEPYLEGEDARARKVAVSCLKAIGGPEAARRGLALLEDGDANVRHAAINLLHAHPPTGETARLLLMWDRTGCPVVRRELPLILGRTPGARSAELGPRLQEHERVRDALLAGAARLGDARARTRFALEVREASGDRAPAMRDLVRYVGQPWVLPALGPWLDDPQVVERLSTHVMSVDRRLCDLAVDLALELAPPDRFSFAARPFEPYTAEEVDAVRRALAAV